MAGHMVLVMRMLILYWTGMVNRCGIRLEVHTFIYMMVREFEVWEALVLADGLALAVGHLGDEERWAKGLAIREATYWETR